MVWGVAGGGLLAAATAAWSDLTPPDVNNTPDWVLPLLVPIALGPLLDEVILAVVVDVAVGLLTPTELLLLLLLFEVVLVAVDDDDEEATLVEPLIADNEDELITASPVKK